MAARKTDPEPFPTRGLAAGYRDIWDTDDRALIEAQFAEQERLMAAVRECARPHRRGRRDASNEPAQPPAPAGRIATDP
jgi:hypothetical protein